MSQAATDSAVQTPPPPQPVIRPLRVWPAVILLALLGLARFCFYLTEEPSMVQFMLAMFGPMVVGLATAIWWAFASRGTRGERWLGLLALVGIGLGTFFGAHVTMRSMWFTFFALPSGLAAFMGTLLLLGRLRSPLRTGAALLAAAVGFGYWDLIQIDGLWGGFQTTFLYRWEPNSEQRNLARLKAQNQSAAAQPDSTSGPLGDVVWPGFRGPDRNSVVPGLTLATDWEQTPPRQIWRRQIGAGWSSFAIAGTRIFTQEQRGDEEAVTCYDADSGEQRWIHLTPHRFWESMAGAGPRATPTIAGDALYVLGATGLLERLDPRTGEAAWSRNLKEDAGRDPPAWGFCSSPLVTDGLVIVHAGGEGDKGVLAYDEQTGEPRWSAPAGDHTYSSPHLAELAGQRCVLMLSNTGLAAIEPTQGKLLWDYAWKIENYRAVQPLVLSSGDVLLGSGMGTGTRKITVGGGAEPTFDIDWTSLRMKPDFNDFVEHQGYLYGFDHDIFACIDLADGKKKWKQGRYGTGQVLLLPDAGQLLVLSERGDLVLLATKPEEHEELASFAVLEGKTWNHPALSGRRIYVRNAEQAACFELP
ncbi:MAG: PQQ-binding-like beta-propeller repeat protein [Pirellulales bacterium]